MGKIADNLVSILGLVLIYCMGAILLVLPATEVRGQNLGIPAPKLTFEIPVNPSSSIRETYNPETAFAQLAWQAFVALNWPADCQGLPLTNKKIGQSPGFPRVWEFYHFPKDIFLPDGRDPRPLRSPMPLTCQTDNDLEIWDLRLTEADDDRMSLLLADRFPLVDREGNYIVNEIRINPVEVNQIVQNRWYAADNLTEFNNSNNLFALACSDAGKDGLYEGEFPCTENQSVGAIEIKAAWKVLPNSILGETNAVCDIPESRYYKNIRTFRITSDRSTKGSEIITVPVGLVGFHISQKTSQQGWIWATFEQVDNAPDATDLPIMRNYTLYDRNCTGDCEPNTPYAREPYLWRREYPHAVTRNERGEIQEQTPSQITRLIPLPAIAKSFNAAWQAKLREVAPESVWQYYQLVGIQWLGTPEVPYNPQLRDVQLREGNQPSMLANTTLESYVQQGPPVYPLGNSCAVCHARATLPPPNVETFADFSYLLNDARGIEKE